MPTLKLSTGSVHYTEHGQGTPLVLLHANPGDSRDYEAVIPTLAKTYRVLALDWPGYGESDVPQHLESANAVLYYNTLREFLDVLKLPPAFFIGNSIGGNVAVRLAADFPERVRGLVLVSPGGFTPHNFFTRTFCQFQGSRFSLSPYRFASLYLKKRTPTTAAMLHRAETIQATPERVAFNRAMWRSFGKPEDSVRQLATRINAPVLLLFGKYDPAIPAGRDGKEAMKRIPSAKMVVLPSGHVAFAEVPELFLKEAQPFLASCANG